VVKFTKVEPEDVPNFRESHRGRVSYPILKTFLETGYPVAQLDRTGMQQSFQGLYSCLTAYIRSHELPIKLFSRGGQLYLARLDMDAEGNVIEDWKQDLVDESEAVEITPEVVQARFVEEKDKVTK
jgi:hypothetical protein